MTPVPARELPRIEWVTGQQPLPLEVDECRPHGESYPRDVVARGPLVVTLRPLARYL